MNKVILRGYLGTDVVVNKTNTAGKAVCNLRVATNHKYTDRNTGQLVEKTQWHTVVVWGKDAENAGLYLRKGSNVLIEGHLDTGREYAGKASFWENRQPVIDSNGNHVMIVRKAYEVISEKIEYLDKKPENNAYQPQQNVAAGNTVIPAPKPNVQAQPNPAVVQSTFVQQEYQPVHNTQPAGQVVADPPPNNVQAADPAVQTHADGTAFNEVNFTLPDYEGV